MAYYRRIRDMREDHDLTQRQLAALLHMPQPQYNRYEQGQRDESGGGQVAQALLHMPQPQYNRYEQGLRDLPTTTLIALADIYHTSTDYLLGRTNDPKPPVSL